MSAGGFASVGGQRVHDRAEQGDELGKLLSLVGLVVEHHEALELDLGDRNVDLLDLWRGRLSFRKIELLIRDLARKPAESRFWTEIDPDAAHAASWKLSDYLAALQVDLMGKAHFQNWNPIPRPDEEIKQRDRRRRLIQRYEDRVRAASG